MKFAQKTDVPIAQSKGEIGAIIGKYAGQLLDINEGTLGRVIVMFRSNPAVPRYLRVTMALPVGPDKADAQARLRKWRALYNDIKFKFVSVDEAIETFDQAFLAWIIGDDGLTMFERVQQLGLLPTGLLPGRGRGDNSRPGL